MRHKTQKERQRDFALEQDLKWLVPLAKRAANRAKGERVCVENVRLAAENGRLQLAFADRGYRSRLFSLVMRRANLERIPGEYIRTPRIGKRGGNLVAAWRRAA